jgi:hypothetical protein
MSTRAQIAANQANAQLTLVPAETHRRLDRCPTLEMNLYALGKVEFAALFPDESREVRQALIQAHTLRSYQRNSEI